MYLKAIDFEDRQAKKLFPASLQQTGFAVLKNTPIDRKLVHDVYQEWEDFFNSDTKHQYTFNRKNQAGFFPIDKAEAAKGYNVADIKEMFHFYRWYGIPDGMSSKTEFLMGELESLSFVLLRWAEEALPEETRANLSMPLCNMVENSKETLFRIIHYPTLKGDEPEGAVWAAAHTDVNFLTMIPFTTAPGLQVLDSDGSWKDAGIDEEAIVINAGDMLAEATNGFFRSSMHRVINVGGEHQNKPRYSMPLFQHPRAEVRLSHTHTQASFLKMRLIELGLLSFEEQDIEIERKKVA